MNCPGCLKENEDTYCNKCIRKLFNGKKVSHILSFTRPEFNEIKRERSGRLSISGIQIKHSLKLKNNELVLTEKGGEYILKPIPSGTFDNLDAVPANENLTMQIASQVFNIKTAENGIIFFKDNEIAYITRRFDILPYGKKLLQEDFAQIAQISEETSGKNYKYDFSYQGITDLMKKYIAAYKVEVEKYFKIISFNFLVSNGDAHIKNFSICRNEEYGDYLLTPFYDLLNTSIHNPGESDTALELFKDDYMTEGYKHTSKYSKDDFSEFALKIGLKDVRVNKIFEEITNGSEKIKEIVNNSFLSDDLKSVYIKSINDRRSKLKYSFSADKG